MKNKIFTACLAAMVLAGCSDKETLNADIPQPEEKPFAFSVFSEKATKADNHTKLDFFYKTFNVYGWKSLDGGDTWSTVFNNVTNEHFTDNTAYGQTIYKEADGKKPVDEWGSLQTVSQDGVWYYQNIRYWDKFATDYQFSAYAPITATSEVTCTSDGTIKIGDSNSKINVDVTNLMATPKTALAYTGFLKDYMTATSTSKNSNEAVALAFSHRLAKINIMLALQKENNKPIVNTAQDVIVKEVTIKNLKDGSYYDSSEENATAGYLTCWATPATAITYTAKGVGTATTGYKMNGETAGTDKFDGYYVMERLLIPQTASKADVKEQLDAYDNEACIYVKYTIGEEVFEGHYALANLFIGSTADDTSYDFNGGNEYTLTLSIGPKPIYFTASVTPWTDNSATVPVN